MKEGSPFTGIKESIRELRAQGVLAVALITLLTSCSLPADMPPAHKQIADSLKSNCSMEENPICWTELRTVRTDLYNYHCWTIMWQEDGAVLEVGNYDVFPSLEACPVDSLSLSPKAIEGRCLVILDNGNGKLDYEDIPARHLCVLKVR